MYNGYASQDEFHAALKTRQAEYIARRGACVNLSRHEGCDHAYGICSAPERN